MLSLGGPTLKKKVSRVIEISSVLLEYGLTCKETKKFDCAYYSRMDRSTGGSELAWGEKNPCFRPRQGRK